MFKHFISASQFTSSEMLEKFFEQVRHTETACNSIHGVLPTARGKVMASWYAEPSTRTRISHETAWLKMGGSVTSTADASSMSSVVKGESWTDSIKTLSELVDIIVARTPREGDAANAATVSKVPFINAGDGCGEHPTQALLDVYTIWKHFGSANNLSVGLVGDLKYSRTVHSLLMLLGLYENITYHLVGPERLMINPGEYIKRPGVHFRVHRTIDDLVDIGPDIIYMTRNQQERHAVMDYYHHKWHHLNGKQVERLPKRAIVMHPLPKKMEISPEVDKDPRAVYWQQVKNGLFVRMTLIRILLEEKTCD